METVSRAVLTSSCTRMAVAMVILIRVLVVVLVPMVILEPLSAVFAQLPVHLVDALRHLFSNMADGPLHTLYSVLVLVEEIIRKILHLKQTRNINICHRPGEGVGCSLKAGIVSHKLGISVSCHVCNSTSQ